MSEWPTVAICDAGPLIHLDELNSLPLLSDFPGVLVPEIVWEEVSRHRGDSWPTKEVAFEKVRATGKIPREIETLARSLALHPGETEALQIAREIPDRLLLSDDTAARLAARHLGLPVHGTLGILLRAIRRGQKSAEETVYLLRSIPKRSSLHIKKELLDEIIAVARGLV